MPTLALLGGAHIHTPGFLDEIARREGVSLAWVWDHDAERAARRAEKLGATPTDDLDAVLADDAVDAVVICSETDRHAALVEPAVEAGRHLFVEKPLGFAGADARRMAEAIESKGLLFQTGYFMRGDARHLWLKSRVEEGWFGKITRVRGSNCHSGALGGWFDTEWRWMANPEIAGCGAFGDLGTHSLDILLWLFGDVTGATGQVDVGTNRYDGCDETGEGLLRFASGAIGTLAAGWDDVANPVSLLVSGTQGHAAIVNGVLHAKGEGHDGPVSDLPDNAPAGFGAFLDALNGETRALVTPSEAARRSEVMEAIYRGAREGTWVAL